MGGKRAAVPPERSVAFTIGVIALGAKIAKADGRVAREEVAAFRRIFKIPRTEERHAAQVFDLARRDVAGFDLWARRIASIPSILGIRTSISTTSGRSASAAITASSPSEASPTTSTPAAGASIIVIPARIAV